MVKEIKINGLKIDDSFSRLYDIDEDGCPIEETTEVTIKNTYTKPYECGGTKKFPKTGGTSSEYLAVLGLGLIGLGYAFKKRR
ncbi:MAG: LPXTG cell wall anchor domain-containing protein [Lachnospiraceae bacterium]|nr:LPXTG cell wall anchor domain-containing protein [Lachnospiraceae bacterium]